MSKQDKPNLFVIFSLHAILCGLFAGLTMNVFTFWFLPGALMGLSLFSAISNHVQPIQRLFMWGLILTGVTGYIVGAFVCAMIMLVLSPSFFTPSGELNNWYALPIALIVGNMIRTVITCFPTCFMVDKHLNKNFVFIIPCASTIGPIIFSCLTLIPFPHPINPGMYLLLFITLFILLQLPTAIAIAYCAENADDPKRTP